MSEQSGAPQPPERPGRYSRTTGGLIGSIVVTVLAVVAFVAFRGLFSDPTAVEPGDVDYLDSVLGLQQAGFDPVYPGSLPSGWRATNVDFETGERPRFELSLLTDDDRYIGLRQQDADVEDLLVELVDDDTSEAEAHEPAAGSPGAEVASSWEGWAGEDGDHGFSATVGEDTVLVFGSADVADLERVVDLLTTAPLATGSSTSPSPDPTPAPGSPSPTR